jgi:hypothetical protein
LARFLLEAVLPFLAPFAAYGAYRLLVTHGRVFLDRTPWCVLTMAGLALACLGIASMAFVGGAPPGGTYVPSRIENGRIVPGEVKTP